MTEHSGALGELLAHGVEDGLGHEQLRMESGEKK